MGICSMNGKIRFGVDAQWSVQVEVEFNIEIFIGPFEIPANQSKQGYLMDRAVVFQRRGLHFHPFNGGLYLTCSRVNM